MANDPRHLAVNWLDYLPVLYRLANIQSGDDPRNDNEEVSVGHVHAGTHPATEREHNRVGIPLSGFTAKLGEVPLRLELLRLGIRLRIVHHCIKMRDNDGSSRDQIPIVDIVFSAAMRSSRGTDGVPPEKFFDESVDVRELGAVGECGESGGANGSVNLCTGILGDVGVLCKDEEEGG